MNPMLEGHEKVVLAALMNGHPELVIEADDFSSPPNVEIFQSIRACIRRGVPPTLLSVQDDLIRRGKLAEIGGVGALNELITLPTDSDNVAFAHSEVLDASRAKRASRIAKNLQSGTIGIEQAAKQLTKLTERPERNAKPLIEFRSPLELQNYTPPPGLVLIGECHVVKGSVFVIGGAPGVGKSRAAVALAVAGATGENWFGLTTHRKFRTMIVQTENGEFRLAREFAELSCDALENFVRVCPPPPFGLCFRREGFRQQLAAAIADFAPDVVIIDPWNAAAREQDSREYLDTFDAFKSVLPLGDHAPALGIVAHTRKPRSDERANGRGLLNLLAGSYVLGSVPRSVFVMQAASDDTTDHRIVWTCAKNNDGELGARSAWERCSGLFEPVHDFDWKLFDSRDSDRRQTVSEADIAEVFADGPLTKSEAAKRLQENTGASKATAYRALDLNGRFRKHLRLEKGLWMWT